MQTFSKWLLLKEVADKNAILNYSLHLMKNALTTGISFDDYKTLVNIASEYIASLPMDQRIKEYVEIQGKIKEISNSIAGADEEEIDKYFVQKFNFPPLGKLINRIDEIPPSHLEFMNSMEEFIDGDMEFDKFKQIIISNADLYHSMPKKDRRRVVMAMGEVAKNASSEVEKENILDFMNDIYDMGR